MPTILPNMGLTLPTRGAGGAGAWGDTLDANLQLEDAHDHTTGRGARITPAAMNINADLPFSSLYAPTQLHRLQFSAIAGAGLTAGQRQSLFVADGTGGLVNHELYYLTNSGASVQITNGSALNVGAFVGGIGGDYQSVSAQLNYTDSTKSYDLKEGTADSNGWARVRCGGLDLYELGTTESVFVRQIAPAALAVSYTMTWPTAVPAAQAIVQIDNTGQFVFSNVMAVDQSITISGTGLYKHGTKTIAVAINGPRTGAAPGLATGDSFTISGASPQAAAFQIEHIPVGARITAIRARIQDSVTGPTKLQITWFASTDGTYGAAISTSATSAGSGAVQTLSMTGLTTTVAALKTYTIQAITTTGAANTFVLGIDVDYDQP